VPIASTLPPEYRVDASDGASGLGGRPRLQLGPIGGAQRNRGRRSKDKRAAGSNPSGSIGNRSLGTAYVSPFVRLCVNRGQKSFSADKVK
jgi:hypothetical protein